MAIKNKPKTVKILHTILFTAIHFNLFYGAFTSIAKTYNYNVSDEIESYRMYRWFWDSVESNSLKINIEGEDPEHAKEMYDEIMVKPEYCLDTKDDDVKDEL